MFPVKTNLTVSPLLNPPTAKVIIHLNYDSFETNIRNINIFPATNLSNTFNHV